MKKDTEFQEIGKKIPYKVPEDFFENISEKMLMEARKREKGHKRKLIVLRTFAVAASLAAVAFLGYLRISSEKPESAQTARIVAPKPVEQPEQNLKTAKVSDSVEAEKPAPVKPAKEIKPDEKITDVLADMSDDELLQMAAMYKTDTFLNESMN